jgi:predicted DCC family thiol-disulfide oxidoreductase YuxK
MEKNHRLVLFDGICNFCNSSVRFIAARDPQGLFRFASLQSKLGQSVLLERGYAPDKLDTMLLIENGRLYHRSTAALRISKQLKFPWNLCYAFIIMPAPVRDLVYRFIGRNRYRWFGRLEECPLPPPGIKERFLDL